MARILNIMLCESFVSGNEEILDHTGTFRTLIDPSNLISRQVFHLLTCSHAVFHSLQIGESYSEGPR